MVLTGIPAFHHHNPTCKFDLFYIDGGHTYTHAMKDMLNCAHLARSGNSNLQRQEGQQLEGREGSLVLMDDLTPWVYWGVGPDRAWREAIETGLIHLVGYFRETLQGEVEVLSGGDRGVVGGEGGWMGGRERGVEEGKWVEMSEEAYRELVTEYQRRREAFQGSDENAEILKVWALGRCTCSRRTSPPSPPVPPPPLSLCIPPIFAGSGWEPLTRKDDPAK